MSEQSVTNVTDNGDTEGIQPRQDNPNAAALQSTIGQEPNESQGRHVGNASQVLGAGTPEVSVTEESHGSSHEQPRKRAKRVIRSMPGSSCLRCKVKKTKCEPSDFKERTCKRYVNRISSEKTGYLVMIRPWAYNSEDANLGIMNANILSKDVSLEMLITGLTCTVATPPFIPANA